MLVVWSMPLGRLMGSVSPSSATRMAKLCRSAYAPAQISICTIAPATMLARIPIAGMLAAAIHPWPADNRGAANSGDHPGTRRYPRIRYYDLLWSPDGQRLATRFSALFPSSGGTISQPPRVGVLLLDTSGKHSQVIQLGHAAPTPLAPQWGSEQAATVSAIPATPKPPYGYTSAGPVLDTTIAVRPYGRAVASY